MTAWMTFSQLRGDKGRSWYLLSDLIAASASAGTAMTRHQVRKAIAALPKPKVRRYGHYHYTDEHMAAVIAVARNGGGA